MGHSRFAVGMSIGSLAALLAACASDADPGERGAMTRQEPVLNVHGYDARMLRVSRPDALTEATARIAAEDRDNARASAATREGESQATGAPFAASAKLKYYGGPVLGHVKVVAFYWNQSVKSQSDLNTFYADITNSAHFDWLSEYNTPTTTIGRGSFLGAVVDPSPPASTNLSNEAVQTELAKRLDDGTLPANGPDNLYMVHFPPGVRIDLDGSGSCEVFCAYHNTFVHKGQNVYYGVMPDQGGSCAGGCGASAATVDNLKSVSSHELIEAVTDPAIGLATSIGYPMAWYDSVQGEIGDICNAMQGKVSGHTVQKEWSNAKNACILVTTTTACTPQCTGKTCGADGCGGSCGTCAGGQSCGADGACHASSGGTGGTCAHAICSTGAKLAKTCDACVTSVCARDAYCCSTSWDSTCVGEVATVCGQSCP